MQEMQIWSLGGEDPLEEGTETHSPILAGKNPWAEETGKESDRTEVTEHAPVSNFKRRVGNVCFC